MKIRIYLLAVATTLATVLGSLTAMAEPSQVVGVGPQYDTTHVYVAPEDVDRFVTSFLATFGGHSTKQVVADVTPTPSSTTSQLLQTPVGTISVFGFKTPIPYPFGAERTGYLVKDLDVAVREARVAGADVMVTPFPDPIGRDAVIQWPGGVNMQLYWHTATPSYSAFQAIPENRVYVSTDRANAFIRSFLAFSKGKVVSDNRAASGAEIGLSSATYRRVRIESVFGKLTMAVTDGHLPYPYGRETTGYEVGDLSEALAKGVAAGVVVLTGPQDVEGRREAVVQFPGGYVAEIHSMRPQTGSALQVEDLFARLPLHRYRHDAVAGKPITHADLDNWAKAWSSHNVETAMALFTKNVVIDQPSNPKPLDFAGAKKFFAMIFHAYPDFHVTLLKPIVDGYDAVSVERVTGTWTGTYTDPASGKSTKGNGHHFDHPGAMVIHYAANHKIDHVSIYWDQLTVDRQLGVKPSL